MRRPDDAFVKRALSYVPFVRCGVTCQMIADEMYGGDPPPNAAASVWKAIESAAERWHLSIARVAHGTSKDKYYEVWVEPDSHYIVNKICKEVV